MEFRKRSIDFGVKPFLPDKLAEGKSNGLALNFSTPLHEKHWIATDFSFPVRYTGICTGEKEVAGCKVNPRRFTPMFCSCSISC